MTSTQKHQDPMDVLLENEMLKEELEATRKKLLDAEAFAIDRPPGEALADLRKMNQDLMSALATAAKLPVEPGPLKKIAEFTKAGPYTLTKERENAIMDMLEKKLPVDSGLSIAVTSDGVVTFSRSKTVLKYDKETNTRYRDQVQISECVHASSLDSVILRVARYLLVL